MIIEITDKLQSKWNYIIPFPLTYYDEATSLVKTFLSSNGINDDILGINEK